ncbi:MAG: 50S ribosomal protein L24 [Deltaproteobacteria bacterium]|nr:50S ribosomal protein L24 [Deltaproteobacteria bacterium]
MILQAPKFKKGDTVVILAGKNKGRQGQILRMLPVKNRLVVERVNMIKRHQKPTQVGQGGIIEKEASIHISNVAIVCPKCSTGVKIGYKFHDDGKKVRVCKRCGEELDT